VLALDHWHIELSSICALKCPRCPRAEIPDSLLNRQLTLEFFKNQLGQDTIKAMRKISFCGNDGDPIYCRDFLEICKWVKEINPTIQLTITTNGSYKPVSWWASLASILTHYDEINWSLDGWDQQSNELYRVNSDWVSIIQGIKEFKKHNNTTYTVWAAIGFRFNQEYILRQQELAKELEFDLYQLTKSTKFGSKYPEAYGIHDQLEPDSELVATGHRFEREVTTITSKPRPGNELKTVFLQRANDLTKYNTYSGICLIGNKGVFLNSVGQFYPCCWTATRYSHNNSWHQLAEKFNLTQKTFREVIEDPFWTTDFLQFDSIECKSKCTRDRLSDLSHTTEW
jgi:MoaA/NifB/PqqE/SkfB family radical SAM enzyme